MASPRSSGAFAPEREAIVRALVDLVAEHGYLRTTIEMVLLRAGVDEEAFDRHFRSSADCLLSAWGEISEEWMRELTDAFSREERWMDGIRAVLYRAVSTAGSDPNRASFGIEVLAAGKAARARRDMTLHSLASMIDAGRIEMADPDLIPRLTAEALAGAVYSQINAKIAAGAHSELLSLVPELVSSIALPYLGHEAALAELSSSSPREGQASVASNGAFVAPSLGEFASRGKRERLIAGLAEAARRYGYGGATISRIAGAAAVSPRSFYQCFVSKAACLDEAFDTVIGELRDRVEREFNAGGRWPNGLPAGISAMLKFLAAEPALAHLCLVEGLAKGRDGARRYRKMVRSFVPFFAEETSAGGVVSVIVHRVMAGEAEELEKLLPDLTVFALAPHLGLAEAECLANA